MPKGYLIAHIRVHDPVKMQEFVAMAAIARETHSCNALAIDPSPDHQEGTLEGMAVILEFDDIEAARRFYHSKEYTAAKAVRKLAADTDLMLVQGL